MRIVDEFRITHGGNLRDLELSLFDTLPDGSRRLFSLVIRESSDKQRKISILVEINHVSRRRAKKFFNIRGKIVRNEENYNALKGIYPDLNLGSAEIDAIYSPGNRKGNGELLV